MFGTPYIYIYIYVRIYIHTSMYTYRYGYKYIHTCIYLDTIYGYNIYTYIDIERFRYRYLEKGAKINLDHKPISSLFLIYAKLFPLGFKRKW